MRDRFREVAESLGDLWSTTRFRESARADYAKRLMVSETRAGVRTMSLILLVPLIVCLLLRDRIGLDANYVYTGIALSALCTHIYFSSRAIDQLETLHLLGMTMLIITGSAFVLLAHKTGVIGTALFSSVVLLFMIIPMVPWGLREASLVTLLVYGMFSASTVSVAGRFEESTLWTLQAFMFAASVVSLTLVGRGARVRKEDIAARFDLEQARRSAERRSLQDPLTGAWNRRYLELEFHGLVERARKTGRPLYFAALDLDWFKQLNDSLGHAAGDEALCHAVVALNAGVTEDGFVARTGGDEFAMLLQTTDPESLLEDVMERFARAVPAVGAAECPVSLSAGVIRIPEDRAVSLDDIYRLADAALYEAKRARSPGAGGRVVRTESGIAPPAPSPPEGG